MSRTHRISVNLTEVEHARLRELLPPGASEAAFFVRLLREAAPPPLPS